MATALMTRVGEKISLNVGSNTSPDQTQVLDWLNEGLRTLKRMLPYDYFPNSQATASAASSLLTVPTDFIKEYAITASGASFEESPVKMVDAPTFMSIKSGINVLKRKSDKYPLGTMQSGKFRALTENAISNLKLRYVKDIGTPLSATSTTASENPIIDKLIVDYAVAQVKYSDDEMTAWQGKLQEWYKSVMDFNFGEINKPQNMSVKDRQRVAKTMQRNGEVQR